VRGATFLLNPLAWHVVMQATKDGVTVSEPFSLETRWDYKLFARPTEWAVGAW